uniref:RAB29, member RAS oncogene family n=1 Tax=Molossus molossus TaxID=27622 RepID=A0A7J8CTC0_MOLMO|nr:RAB29, member RAS oncogene family [Molossus molossus]
MGSRDHLFKVLVVGDPAVGKTSLVQRYSQDSFNKHYKSTVGGTLRDLFTLPHCCPR